MFIDFLPLMLINMSAGLILLLCYGFKDFGRSDRPQWAPAFTITGLIASICGFYLIFKFPLPGPYNIAFGETSVLLGMLFLGGAWTVAKGWSLTPLAIYSIFAGLIAILIGAEFLASICWPKGEQFTQSPFFAGIGFILTGLAGILFGPVLWIPLLRFLRWVLAVSLIIAAAIWVFTACVAYWMHLMHFKQWIPLIFQQVMQK